MGVVAFYLCFGGTWVPVMTEKDLLGLIWIAGVVAFYLCFGGTWVPVTTEKDLLGLIWIARNCFDDFMSYLCLNGAWVFISTGNRLENSF